MNEAEKLLFESAKKLAEALDVLEQSSSSGFNAERIREVGYMVVDEMVAELVMKERWGGVSDEQH